MQKYQSAFFPLGDVIQANIIFLCKSSYCPKFPQWAYIIDINKKLLNQGLKKNGHFYIALFVPPGSGVWLLITKMGLTNQSFIWQEYQSLKKKKKKADKFLIVFPVSPYSCRTAAEKMVKQAELQSLILMKINSNSMWLQGHKTHQTQV